MGRKSYQQLADEMGISVEEYKALKNNSSKTSKKETPVTKDKNSTKKTEAKKPTAKKKKAIEVPNTSSSVTEDQRKETAKKFNTKPNDPYGIRSFMMQNEDAISVDLPSTIALDRIEVKKMKGLLISKEEMRFIVDSKYQAQRNRIACANRIRAIEQLKDNMPDPYTCDILRHDLTNLIAREKMFDDIIDAVTDATPVGRWLRSITGIGPTIAACLIAYFDIERVNYASHFLSYAGQNDSRRPWLGQSKSEEIVNSLLEPAKWVKVERECVEKTELPVEKDKKINPFIDDRKIYMIDGIPHICMTKYNPFIWKNNGVEEEEWIPVEEFMTPIDGDDYYENSHKFYVRDEVEIIEQLIRKDEEDKVSLANFGVKFVHRGDVLRVGDTLYICIKGGEPEGSKKITDNHIVELCAMTQWKFTHFQEAKSKSGAYDKKKVINRCAMVPYNMTLKTLMYKISDSFIKNKGRGSLYGRIYTERKAEEIRKNEAGEYKEIALRQFKTKKFVKKEMIECYSSGKLSPLHIELRSRRIAIRVFLVHVFEEMWWENYNTEPPKFYPFASLGHMDYIGPEVPYMSTRNESDIERLNNNLPINNKTMGVKINFTHEELKEISARSGVKFEDLPEYTFDDNELDDGMDMDYSEEVDE